MAKGLFDCTGKVTMVTGGNSGIGLGFALGPAKMGGDIAIWARNAEKNAKAKKLLATVKPRSLVGKTTRRMAVEEVADLIAADTKLKTLQKELKAAVLARPSTPLLASRSGIGSPARAAAG